MATPFHVEIVTPERVLHSGEAEEVSMRTDAGEIAFLAHHEDFIGAADITVVRVRSHAADAGEAGDAEGSELRFAVHGGFVHVDQDADTVTILAGVAERGDQIDVGRARAALAAAEERFATEGPAAEQRTGTEAAPAAVAEEAPPTAARLSGAMVGLLAPESAEAALRRARARLEAAGAAEPV
jgi:F-type H+-transporting ATPase subunit epsilon